MTVTTVKDVFGNTIGTTDYLAQFIRDNGARYLNLMDCNFYGEDFTDCDFTGAVIDHADFRCCNLTGTQWHNASIRFANFSDCVDPTDCVIFWPALTDDCAVMLYDPVEPEEPEYPEAPSLPDVAFHYFPADYHATLFKVFGSADNLQWSAETRDGQIAYSPEGVAPNDNKRRRRSKLGRYLVRQWGLTLSNEAQRAIEKTVSEYPVYEEFEILRGRDIVEAYANDVGNSSCMSGDDSYLVELYANNPKKVGLLVWRETRGRALLWDCDNGTQYLDRIYAGDSAASAKYEAWCNENNVDSYDFGNGRHNNREVSLRGFDEECTPYMDSFIYADEDGCFYNYEPSGCSGYYHCQSTSGCVELVKRCELCERAGDNVESVDYNNEDTPVCENCRNHISYCEDCNTWRDSDDFSHLEGFDRYVCSGCDENYCHCDCGHCTASGDENTNSADETYCDDCDYKYADEEEEEDCDCSECTETA